MSRTKNPTPERAARMREVLTLRVSGWTLSRIGEKYGISSMQVHRDITEATSNIFREKAEELLTIELERLDALQAAIWGNAMEGKLADRLAAIDQILRIMNRRAKYTGLDSAIKVDASAEIRAQLAEAFATLDEEPLDGLDPEAAGE